MWHVNVLNQTQLAFLFWRDQINSRRTQNFPHTFHHPQPTVIHSSTLDEHSISLPILALALVGFGFGSEFSSSVQGKSARKGKTSGRKK